jgi:hypothetical protein
MCENCWKEYGSPKMETDAVKRGIQLVKRVYKRHLAGGGCHIVTDDWNLEDEHVDFCLDYIPKMEIDEETTAKDKKDQMACMEAFKAMTVPERASTLYWYNRIWIGGHEEGADA